MTQSLDGATATVYLNGGPEAAFQAYLRAEEHAKPFLGTHRHTGFLEPRKGLLGTMGTTHCTCWLFPLSTQQGSESVWDQLCQTTSGEAQSRVSKTKETQPW